jgi:hypothetical protein
MLSGNSLSEYYKTRFAMHYHHNYSMTEIDNLLPWELDVEISLLMDQLRKEAEERNIRRQQQKWS